MYKDLYDFPQLLLLLQLLIVPILTPLQPCWPFQSLNVAGPFCHKPFHKFLPLSQVFFLRNICDLDLSLCTNNYYVTSPSLLNVCKIEILPSLTLSSPLALPYIFVLYSPYHILTYYLLLNYTFCVFSILPNRC